MVCQICGKKSGFFPLCKKCNSLKEKNKISKCKKCGKWNDTIGDLCKECYFQDKIENEKKSPNYVKTPAEKEESDFRKKYKAEYRTVDGHYVRSKAEQIIDDWLYNNDIIHAYERQVPIKENLCSDFYIKSANIWIEYWGSEEKGYVERKETKKKLYEKYDKKLIEINDKEIKNLDDFLPKELGKYGINIQ